MSQDHNLPPGAPSAPVAAWPYHPQQVVGQPATDWVEQDEPELNIMEYVNLVWARKWIVLAVMGIVVALAGSWAFTRPKLYRSTAKITIQPSPQLSRNQLDMAMNWWQMDRFIADQVEVLSTHALAQRVADKLGLESQMGRGAANVLLGSLEVKPLENTFVIVLRMRGRDPEQAAEWLNVYIREYIQANIEDNLQRTREVYQVIQSRLEPLRQQMEASEAAVMQFKERENAVLFADQDKNVITEQVNKLTTEYANAKAERIRLETKVNALQQLRASNLSEVSFPEVLQDATIQGLRQQRNDLEVELTEKLRSLKEGHPQIKELRSRLFGIDDQIHKQINTIRGSLQNNFNEVSQRERSLYDNIQSLRDQSIELSKQTMEYDRLRRDYEQSKTFYEEMLARSKEADISTTNAVNNVRVIEPARAPGGPYSPNIQRALTMALVLGGFLGIGLVLGLDFLDHTLRTPEQVERYVGLEVLSTLPKFTEDKARALRESFQSLRTALMLAARGEGCQVLMVTSAVPSEGKTTVAFNLGKVFATGGARVLLIDADLRKPRLHRLIKAKNVRGLTSVVLGERELADVKHALADVPNMDLITSGPLPPNPPELFGKMTFRRILEAAREQYDWVVIDTPPVASVTDPVMCAASADMVLLVVQYGSVKRQVVREAVRLLARTGVRLAGVLLNKVDLERDHYYYYSGYYSYYHYQYASYGDEPEDKSGAISTSSAARGKAG